MVRALRKCAYMLYFLSVKNTYAFRGRRFRITTDLTRILRSGFQYQTTSLLWCFTLDLILFHFSQNFPLQLSLSLTHSLNSHCHKTILISITEIEGNPIGEKYCIPSKILANEFCVCIDSQENKQKVKRSFSLSKTESYTHSCVMLVYDECLVCVSV